ncbi:MAG: hypothetical protein HY607_11220 [Planctomycetes bacterium]|nr:hypothetical protein [Planctomycetota bacterium]MBI4223233.1 hypothetical protein [Planctomycetota bacterium]
MNSRDCPAPAERTPSETSPDAQGVNLRAVIEKLNPVIRGYVNYFRPGDVRKR